MLGVYDSGMGGKFAASYLSTLVDEEVHLLTDYKNAPFGTKDVSELVPVLERAVNTLSGIGVRKALLACCTMCTVLPFADEECKRYMFPITEHVARAAYSKTKNGKIAVIATERTVASGEFTKLLRKLCPDASVREIPTQYIVEIAESDTPPTRLQQQMLMKTGEEICSSGADCLILGCTHFSAVKDFFKEKLSGVAVIDSALVGALAFAEEINKIKK